MNLEEKKDTLAQKIFQYSLKKGKEFYFKNWAKNPPKPPVFKGEIVHISREGWEHIVEDVSRHWIQIIVRISLFERAKTLLELANHYQEHNKGKEYEFWAFRVEIGGVSIKVVIRSINKGPKHRYSIMPKGSVANAVVREMKIQK